MCLIARGSRTAKIHRELTRLSHDVRRRNFFGGRATGVDNVSRQWRLLENLITDCRWRVVLGALHEGPFPTMLFT